MHADIGQDASGLNFNLFSQIFSMSGPVLWIRIRSDPYVIGWVADPDPHWISIFESIEPGSAIEIPQSFFSIL